MKEIQISMFPDVKPDWELEKPKSRKRRRLSLRGPVSKADKGLALAAMIEEGELYYQSMMFDLPPDTDGQRAIGLWEQLTEGDD